MSDEEEIEELARRATEFYDAELRQKMELEHRDEFIAVEPESRTYYLGKSRKEASRQARTAFPNRRCYMMRVGHQSAMQIGWYES